MLTCPATVIVDGNKTKDISHVEAGLKGYVFGPSHQSYRKNYLTDGRSAMHNENLPVESQFAAAEKLGEIQK